MVAMAIDSGSGGVLDLGEACSLALPLLCYNDRTMTYKTPMLQQYQEIKEQYPDCLLFFRLGDFYELFGDDAKIGSEVLHITLTARDKGGDGKIPMCGVPFHASENYIARLVNAGYKVAICEQVSEAGKGLVKREVIRVVTAGTLLRDESLTDAASQYVMSLVIDAKKVGGAAADLSTGQFYAFEFAGDATTLIPLLVSHFHPRECIVPRTSYDNSNYTALIRQERGVNLTCAHDWKDYTKQSAKSLTDHFHVDSLDSFGISKKPLAIAGAAALLGYLQYTQKGDVAHITRIQDFHFTGHLVLDQTTMRHLEIVRTQEGTVDGSLFGTLNHTVTAAGQRLFLDWLIHPVTSKSQLEKRHSVVEELLGSSDLVSRAREQLAHVSDSERLVGRLSVGLGSPRDLRRLADTLFHAQDQVLPLFANAQSPYLKDITKFLNPDLLKWIEHLREILFAEAKPTLDDGYIFQNGFHAQLDELRELTSGNQSWLTDYEEKERARTNIPKLKVVYSRAFGYAIEVTNLHKDKVPGDYVPRQTLVNANRYTTQALADYEKKALSAMDQMIALEKQFFAEKVREVIARSSELSDVAHQLALLDVFLNLAHIAKAYRYIKPKITDEIGIHIEGGRHPVIEQLHDQTFVDNDTELMPNQSLQLITGPNMAGKSTYIRQVALIVLLGHTGSFVPAKSAKIGVTDRIFTRIGAHDNLRAGQSTFMVEMLETAHILHNATERSLVILDEVGRGTSPEDGFALAWAIAESLAQPKAGLVLFATHFHALKDLANKQPCVFNSHLAVAVDNDDFIFLRKVTPGPTDESYGIVVAEKAGIPKAVVARAKKLADETPVVSLKPAKVAQNQMPLLPVAVPQNNQITDALKEIKIDELTPLEALTTLNELKKLIK